jgi:hypothetical protein
MPVGFGVLKVNNMDGTIRFGTYEVELYKPPVNLVRKNPMDKLKSSIKITLAQPHFSNARPQT